MTTETLPLPEPPNGPEVDLRGFDFMPFYGEFLRRSGFNCRVTDAEFRAGVNLWWSAWWQVPAGSLPDNDRELCKLADVDDIRKWHRVKVGAMSGFAKFADNRFHHCFISVIAREIHLKRRTASFKGKAGAAKRWKDNDKQHAPGNATGNAPAIPQTMPQPSLDPWLGQWLDDSKGEESLSINTPMTDRTGPVDKPQPQRPNETSRSKPRDRNPGVEKTLRMLEDQRAQATEAAPMPEHLKRFAMKRATEDQQHHEPDQTTEAHDHAQPQQPDNPDASESLDT